MVFTLSSKYLPSIIMCNFAFPNVKKQRYSRSGVHFCTFKILQCSSQQLSIFCFLLHYFAAGNYAHAVNVPYPPQTTTDSNQEQAVQCFEDACYIKISSSREALENMEAVSEQLFDAYAITNGSQKLVDEHGMKQFINDVGLVRDDHDHEHHDAVSAEDIDDFLDYFYEDGDEDGDEDKPQNHENATKSRKRRSDDDEEFPCYPTMKELVSAYFHPRQSEDIQLSFGDFVALMPRLLLDLKRPECRYEGESEEEHNEAKKDRTGIEHSAINIWLISFASVLVISLVSFLGVMVIPLLRHSKILNHVIAFLVALAVGTLIGDSLLHLLPHASGAHDHSDHGGHDHSSEPDDHFDSMWKGLVACVGVYAFFLLEAGMAFIRRNKSERKSHELEQSCGAESPTPTNSSPSKQVLKEYRGTDLSSPSDSPLLKVPKHNHDGRLESLPNEDAGNCIHTLTPDVEISGAACKHGNARRKSEDQRDVILMDEEPLETGHHHHHTHEVPQTIASLAWMVIVGDGLHNVTDGLAIGVAFASSIGTGLGTVLAIFFHEIPQELGDFAILLNAGMTVKQAAMWNFLSACMCFVGLLIGLLVGEYTNGAIPWILAFTAGGFLYIALVDMLPTMIKQLGGKEYLQRFLLQNIGMLVGLALMVLIALKEEAFANYF